MHNFNFNVVLALCCLALACRLVINAASASPLSANSATTTTSTVVPVPAHHAGAMPENSVLEEELPCLNKPVGFRIAHPLNTHKFLRCISDDTLWIETCPDNLFFNPGLGLCDWSVISESTTGSNEVVKNRPVLFKSRVSSRLAKLIAEAAASTTSTASITTTTADDVAANTPKLMVVTTTEPAEWVVQKTTTD